jgi:hypothetical protein
MLKVERSMEPLTEFSPTWQIPFWFAKYPNESEIDFMRQWIIDNEDRIIKENIKNTRNDGGTGLGTDSLTAQYTTYNLFADTKDIPQFQNLFDFLRTEYSKFMQAVNAQNRLCSMYAWANVIRPGQQIKKHHHGASHYAYLSGNMHFENYETITRYHNPYAEVHYDCTNIKGGVTFFCSYLYHETTVHEEDKFRVSFAFDLYDKRHASEADNNKVDF